MKFVQCAQGTPEWAEARAGLTTASMFCVACKEVGGLDEKQAKYVAAMLDNLPQKMAMAAAGYKAAPTSEAVRRALLGEKVTDFSDEAKRYAADIAIELISGKPHGEPAKAWVLERGHEMESRARMAYEISTGAFVTESGICIDDEGFGYSSDGLVNDDGLIEIKAPIDSAKIMAMLRTGDVSEYMHQMQGGMWITGRKWCDFIQFVPDLESVGKHLYIKRIERDDAFIDSMVKQLTAFQALVQENLTLLRAA